MYVCVCNAISDRQLKQAVDEGIVSIGKLKKHLDFESCCGRCTDCLRDLVAKYQQECDPSCPRYQPQAEPH